MGFYEFCELTAIRDFTWDFKIRNLPRLLKSWARRSDWPPALAFDCGGMDTSGVDSGAAAAAAGIPKNSETSKGGAPELSPINMKANKIVDFPIFVRLVMMVARIKVSDLKELSWWKAKPNWGLSCLRFETTFFFKVWAEMGRTVVLLLWLVLAWAVEAC